MPNLLRISEAVSLAFHASALLAAADGKMLLTRSMMAQFLNVSEAHLTKVLQRLGRLGIVSSTRGPRGGFYLNRAALKISLLNIYEAIDGPVSEDHCLLNTQVCQGAECVLGDLLRLANKEGRYHLEQTTLHMVAAKTGDKLLKALKKSIKED